MTDSTSPVAILGNEIDLLLAPLVRIAETNDPSVGVRRFLQSCGWTLAPGIDVTSLLTSIELIRTEIEVLTTDPVPDSIGELTDRLEAVKTVVESVQSLGSTVSVLAGVGPASAEELAELGSDIVHCLVITWLRSKRSLAEVLLLLGAIKAVPVDAVDLGVLSRPEGEAWRVSPAALTAFLTAPVEALQGQLAPRSWSSADGAAASNLLAKLLISPLLRLVGGEYTMHRQLLRPGDEIDDIARRSAVSIPLPTSDLSTSVGAELEFLPGSNPNGPALRIAPFGSLAVDTSWRSWGLTTSLAVTTSGAADAAALTVGPNGIESDFATEVDFGFGLSLPLDLLLGGGNSGLYLGTLDIGGFASSAGDGDFGFHLSALDSSIGIDTADLGSTVSSLISFVADVPFDLGLAWSRHDGLRLINSASLEVSIGQGLTIGGGLITISAITVSVGVSDVLEVIARGDVAFNLGPVTASLEGLGVAAVLDLAATDGNLGGADLGVDAIPPTGLGIGLDVGVASGGGFLSIDTEAGSYEGVLDLEVLGVGISAVAIIDTQLPDVDGWSMFFALFLDLPSIQLGFGFALTGVGGLAGINRGIDADALGSAVRSGSLDTILFPEDPIANAPVIIDEFRSIFPAANDSYVFGPIVKIAWGTPALIEAELGIVIQLPDPVVIVVLGSLSAVLPTKEAALVALNLDVAGSIDFEAGTLAMDASLHSSHVVGFALSGDMALRAEFGNAQAFLLSVGGFNPRFDPPGDFPQLSRLSFGISAADVLRLDFQAYFALTSNSVQIGARFTLDADVLGFGVYGEFGFETLMEFSPFKVAIDVDFTVAITAVGVDLAGVDLTGSLTGPNAWRFIGEARFKVLGIGKDIRVDEVIGKKENEAPISAPDLIGDLLAELESPDAWEILQVNDPAVTLREPSVGEDVLLANPDSTIELRQRLVPLGIELEQFGKAPVGEYSTFDLSAAEADSASSVDDWFAPGQFRELNETEKLTGPEFESMPAGLMFGGNGVAVGDGVDVDLGYQSFVIDPEFENDYPLVILIGLTALAGALLTTGTYSFTAVQDEQVATLSPEYLVVDLDGAVVDRTSTWTEAQTVSSSDNELHIERTFAEVTL